MSTSSNQWSRPVIASLLCLWLVWGSIYVALAVVVREVPPLLVGGLRNLISGLLLFAYLRVQRKPWPSARHWVWAVPMGALFFLVGNGVVSVAARHLPSGLLAVAAATAPLWAAAMGPLFKERSSAAERAGVVIGFVGTLALALNGELRGQPLLASLMFIAPGLWAFGSLLARRIDVAQGLGAVAAQMLVGGLMLTGVAAMTGERWPTNPWPSWSALSALAYLVLFGSLLGFVSYAYLLKAARPSVAMSYAYVNPAIAVFLGALLNQEPVAVSTIVATGLIVVGTAVLLRAKPG